MACMMERCCHNQSVISFLMLVKTRGHCVLVFGKVHVYTLLSPNTLVTLHSSTGTLFHLLDLSKAMAVSNFERGGLAEALHCTLSLK